MNISKGTTSGLSAGLGFNLGIIFARWDEIASWQALIAGALVTALLVVVGVSVWSDRATEEQP